MPTLDLKIFIAAPTERCFDLATSIDLHRMSTAGTAEEAIAGVTSGLIKSGEQVTWRARHFGIRQTFTSRITLYERPFMFRDEMMQGAFKSFKHDHTFDRVGDHCLMRDVLTFESPGGVIGQMVNRLILTNYLRDFLLKRNEMIKNFAEGEQWKTILKD